MFCHLPWDQKISPLLQQSTLVKNNNYGRVIIELAGKESGIIKNLIEKKEGKIKQETSMIHTIVADIPMSALPELAQSKQVKKIWADCEVKCLS